MNELCARILSGDMRAVARACRLIDEQKPGFDLLLRELFPHTGKARVIGVTGSPGVGKSTLVDGLIGLLRGRGERVGVIAIDPSSPFSGGALLGDRIRMQRHAADDEVFIRSFGTRGSQGGLSRSTLDCVQVLDAWGAQSILLETVGVGQAEVDVLGAADSVVVVVIPGMGDAVQASKAGILEVADVIALNKADHAGVEAMHGDLESVASSGRPAIVRTVAIQGQGLPELLSELDAHALWLRTTDAGRARSVDRKRRSLSRHLQAVFTDALLLQLGPRIAELARRVQAQELDPYAAADELLGAYPWLWK